jgi:solute carrier family 25 carnitine/acylcarnitine transporter 20/29
LPIILAENFLKTQMQLDNIQDERDKMKKGAQSATESSQKLKGRFTGSFHCAKTLVTSHGLPVLYTGHVINTIREAAFVGMYFYCYEGFKVEFKSIIGCTEKFWRSSFDFATDNPEQESLATSLAIPIAGGCAGATSWAFTFPLDCVRAGVQGQHITETYIRKQGAFETLKLLWQTKGITGLYAGVGPSIARAFLVSGSRFSAYEGAVTLCRWSGLSPGNTRYGEESSGSYDD